MKFPLTSLLVIVALAASAPPAHCLPEADDSSKQAMRVLDEFMTAFNARDEEAWMATLHFPHVRVASGVSHLTVSPEAMMSEFDFERFALHRGAATGSMGGGGSFELCPMTNNTD